MFAIASYNPRPWSLRNFFKYSSVEWIGMLIGWMLCIWYVYGYTVSQYHTATREFFTIQWEFGMVNLLMFCYFAILISLILNNFVFPVHVPVDPAINNSIFILGYCIDMIFFIIGWTMVSEGFRRVDNSVHAKLVGSLLLIKCIVTVGCRVFIKDWLKI
jgi:hypothetical protein